MKAVLAVLVFVLKAVGAVLAAVIVLAALLMLLKVGVEAHVRKDDEFRQRRNRLLPPHRRAYE